MIEHDIVVIGGGSGSQVATAAADRGLDAAVIEPGPLGGACITRGCVPSKALLHRADLVDEIRRADRFGVDATVEGVDYEAITSSIHDTVYGKADRQERSLEDADNVTLYRSKARFVDDRTLAIDATESEIGSGATESEADSGAGKGGSQGDADTDEISGEHVVIAVGGRPMVPPIDGLDNVDFLTSDDALFLDTQPADLVIVGGGYIGVELGYFFGALGTEVSIVGRSDRLVPGEDDDVSEVVTESLETHCECYTGYEAAKVGESGNGDRISVIAEPSDGAADGGGDQVELTADELLLATGRRPNTDTLDLDTTGIEVGETGHVETDERLETTVENVWALGDVLADQPFKHVADYEAEIVAVNIIDGADRTVDSDAMAHAIFTSPQVARVGETEGELDDADREYESTLVGYDAAPKGLILDAEDGFVKVLSEPEGEILGCHIVGPDASTLLHEVVVAMERGEGTVDDIAETVHIHPALNEVVLKAFDEAADRSYSTAPDWRDASNK